MVILNLYSNLNLVLTIAIIVLAAICIPLPYIFYRIRRETIERSKVQLEDNFKVEKSSVNKRIFLHLKKKLSGEKLNDVLTFYDSVSENDEFKWFKDKVDENLKAFFLLYKGEDEQIKETLNIILGKATPAVLKSLYSIPNIDENKKKLIEEVIKNKSDDEKEGILEVLDEKDSNYNRYIFSNNNFKFYKEKMKNVSGNTLKEKLKRALQTNITSRSKSTEGVNKIHFLELLKFFHEKFKSMPEDSTKIIVEMFPTEESEISMSEDSTKIIVEMFPTEESVISKLEDAQKNIFKQVILAKPKNFINEKGEFDGCESLKNLFEECMQESPEVFCQLATQGESEINKLLVKHIIQPGKIELNKDNKLFNILYYDNKRLGEEELSALEGEQKYIFINCVEYTNCVETMEYYKDKLPELKTVEEVNENNALALNFFETKKERGEETSEARNAPEIRPNM